MVMSVLGRVLTTAIFLVATIRSAAVPHAIVDDGVQESVKPSGALVPGSRKLQSGLEYLFPPTIAPTPVPPDSGATPAGGENEAPKTPVEGDKTGETETSTTTDVPSSQPTSVPTIKETVAPHGPEVEDTAAPTVAETSATTAAITTHLPSSQPTSMPTIKETVAPHGLQAEDTPAPTVSQTSATTAAPSNGADESIPVVPVPAPADTAAPSVDSGSAPGDAPTTGGTGKRPGGRPGGGGGRGKKSRSPTMRGSRKPSPSPADSGGDSGNGASNGGSDTPPNPPTLAPTRSSDSGGSSEGGPYDRYGKDDDNWTDSFLGPDYSSNFVMIIVGILLVAVIACFVWVYNQCKRMCTSLFGDDPGGAPSDGSYTPVNTTDFDRVGVDRNDEDEVWDSWDDDHDIEMTMPKQSAIMRSYSGDRADDYKSSVGSSSSRVGGSKKDSPSRVKKIETSGGWDLDDDLDLDLSLDHVDKDTSYDSLPGTMASPSSTGPSRSPRGFSGGLSDSTMATNPKAGVKVIKGMSLPGAPAKKK